MNLSTTALEFLVFSYYYFKSLFSYLYCTIKIYLFKGLCGVELEQSRATFVKFAYKKKREMNPNFSNLFQKDLLLHRIPLHF